MFGFSLAELLVVLLVILIFIKPQDLPEIANFIGRMIYRAKKFFSDSKNYLTSVESEIGLDKLKEEMSRGIAEEKAKLEDETTVIVDMYGNEHVVSNVKELRGDLDEESLKQEVAKLNEENSKKNS